MKKQHVAVLSIGSSAVCVAVGHKGVNDTSHILARSVTAYEGYSSGAFVDPDEIGGVFEAAVRQAESVVGPIKRVYVGVPTEFIRVVVKEVSASYRRGCVITEQMTEELFDHGNVYDTGGLFTVINRSALYYNIDDRKLIEAVGEKTANLRANVSYILADNEFLNLMRVTLLRLGIEDVRFISEALCQYLYLIPPKNRQSAVLIADVGHIAGSVVYAMGGGLISAHSFMGGGGLISLDLSAGLGISFAQAEELKKRVMLTLEPASGERIIIDENLSVPAAQVKDIMTDALYKTAEQVAEGITACGVPQSQNTPLYLVGGGLSFIRGAADVLERVTGRAVTTLAPPLPLMKKRYDLCSLYSLLDTAAAHEQE